MYYLIYKITNKITGKYYIGSHKTKNINDNYMGSGKYLKNAQKKYGIENFEKEILFVYDTAEEMYSKEREIVNEDFLTTENTYNLKIGGFGGWDFINNDEKSRVLKNKKARKKADEIILEKYGVKNPGQLTHNRELNRERMLALANLGLLKPPSFKDKKHSEKTKQIIGEKNSVHQAGSGNSQFGTRWIHSITEKRSMKISKNSNLPDGWLEGRKMKFC